MLYFLNSSFGNDSFALMAFAHKAGLKDVTVVHADTGWSVDWWRERVELGEKTCKELGFGFVVLQSIGMEELVKKYKWFPQYKNRFCTKELKIEPMARYLDKVDPNKESIIMVGVRREESMSRAEFPEYSDGGPDGREMWAPLVRHTEAMRDELLTEYGINVLPHRSRECFPCIFSGRGDVVQLNEPKIRQIEAPESQTPGSHFFSGGGIRNVWLNAITGNFYQKRESCDNGYCGG